MTVPNASEVGFATSPAGAGVVTMISMAFGFGFSVWWRNSRSIEPSDMMPVAVTTAPFDAPLASANGSTSLKAAGTAAVDLDVEDAEAIGEG